MTNKKNQFEQQYNKLLDSVKQAKPGNEALEFLRELRLNFDSIIPGYRNSLTILGDTTYEDRKHFLLELIQNADDAIYESEKPIISFSIHGEYLEISYNELGFTTNDVIGITGTGASTKKANKLSANSFIGEKGIGFKSVFALAKEVQIESGPWRFRLLKENYIVPELIDSLNEISVKGTKLRVFFSNKESVSIVADELSRLVTRQLESFLFLQKLKTFNFCDFRKQLPEKHQLTIKSNAVADTINLHTSPGDLHRSYSLYEEEIEFPGLLVGSRWERLGSQHPLKRKMAVAAITKTASNQQDHVWRPNTKREPTGRLFCYLPTEVKLPVPIFLQLDGHLKADRERLHDINNNTWNRYLLERVPTFLLHAILTWRSHDEMATRLADFVPDHPGNDQLSEVFETLIDKCSHAPWVRTFDGWDSPGHTVMAEPFWYKWFDEYPDFRKQVEKVVGKRFMHPLWVENSSWKRKWEKYSISYLSAIQIAEILRFVSLPSELLKNNENINHIYNQLLKMHDSIRYSARMEFVQELYFAKVFPLEDGGFGPLKKDDSDNVKLYWMSGKTRRTSGLEGVIDVKIIDPEYTYTANVAVDTSEERKEEAKKISLRNGIVRQVLRLMDVPEFNDDRLLTELQIPYLLGVEEKWTTEKIKRRYRVMKSIFDVYHAKRNLDEGYLSQLSRLSEAIVSGTNGKVKKMHRTVLPERARLYEEDHVYSNTGLDSIDVPDSWFEPEIQGDNQAEKKDVYLKSLRQFLIHCGVANNPKFLFENRKYSSGMEFRQTEEALYQAWYQKINGEYTYGNSVSLKSVSLDPATLKLIKNGKVTVDIAKGLYAEWLNQFSRNLSGSESLYFRYNPPAGYFQANYKRFENRSPIIRDTQWAGLRHEEVPLLTLDGRVTNKTKAFKISQVKGLDNALEYFDLVLENGATGYHPYYLSSIGLGQLTTDIINQKWREVGEEHHDALMRAMYELSVTDIDLSELIIYDKVSNRFRPIRNFRLGKAMSSSTPYIEEQYGHYGKLLGGKLGLSMDSEVTPLLETLDKFFQGNQTDEWLQYNFTNVFKQWIELKVDDKGKLIRRLTELKNGNQIDTDMLVIFNDGILYQKIKQINKYVIHIECETLLVVQMKKAVKELGFSLIEDVGTIKVSGKSPLQNEDALLLGKLLDKFDGELEEEESARLFSVLSKLGGKAELQNRIVQGEELNKVVYGIPMPLSFPYYDPTKNFYFVPKGSSLYEIAARVLSSFEFTTFRSAIRDFKDIYGKMIRAESLKPSMNTVEKKIDKTNDSSYEFEISNEDITSSPKEVIKKDSSVQELVGNLDSKVGEYWQEEKEEGTSKEESNNKDSFPLNKSFISKEEVYQQISESMLQDSNRQTEQLVEDWKLAIDPEEAEVIRQNINTNLHSALKEGPEYKEVKEKEREQKPKVKVQDPTAQDPKEFLYHEYNGRCQICSTRLQIAKGKAYFEVFRIRESKGEAWWSNRPFNILSLCPNCHALAKHGGGNDFRSIFDEAELLWQQLTFPEEVEKFNGDFYEIKIIHNGERKSLVLSSIHLEYFSALKEYSEEAKQVPK